MFKRLYYRLRYWGWYSGKKIRKRDKILFNVTEYEAGKFEGINFKLKDESKLLTIDKVIITEVK